MSTIEMRTELPGPKAREIIARKERVVCDPLDLHVPTVIEFPGVYDVQCCA